MAYIKISQLPEVQNLSTTDVVPFVTSGITSKITLQRLAATIPQVSSSISALTASYVTASNVYGPYGSNSVISSSHAVTASYALNSGGGSNSFPYNGTAIITGSLLITNQTSSISIQPFVNLDVDIGTEIVASIATSSYDSAFFDYVAKDGTNYRAGTVVAVWNNITWSYTDTSVTDIGDTTPVTMSADVNNGNVRLKATVTTNNWIIKTVSRVI